MDIIGMFINKTVEKIKEEGIIEEVVSNTIEKDVTIEEDDQKTSKSESTNDSDTNNTKITEKGEHMSVKAKKKIDDIILQVLEENPDLGLSKEKALKFGKAIFEKIVEEVANGNAVSIYKFGTFSPRFQKGREGFNNAIGKPFKSEDKYVPKFEVSDSFKERVASNLKP